MQVQKNFAGRFIAAVKDKFHNWINIFLVAIAGNVQTKTLDAFCTQSQKVVLKLVRCYDHGNDK